MPAIDVPHLRWPFRLTAGADLPGQVPHAPLQLVEQDTIDDVRQSVHLLMRTPRGARPLAPDVGIDDPTFSVGIDPQLLAAQIEEFEDRARVTVATAGVDAAGQQTVTVRVALVDDDTDQEVAT
jgi:phage baseplate assembly protein W